MSHADMVAQLVADIHARGVAHAPAGLQHVYVPTYAVGYLESILRRITIECPEARRIVEQARDDIAALNVQDQNNDFIHRQTIEMHTRPYG